MAGKKRIRDYGIEVGTLKPGSLNSITDVEGVTVGHTTIHDGEIHTGVTAIKPHGGNVFREKVPAAAVVLNGFGKTMGTIQIEELGTIETPILLTNTLSIGLCADALIDYMLEQTEEIGRTEDGPAVRVGTVNPVVGECNDMFLNDIRAKAVTKKHVFSALHHTGKKVEEGAVGAGAGMACFGLKGGVGTSSRVAEIGGTAYTVGILVVSNFGLPQDLRINGKDVGNKLVPMLQEAYGKDAAPGSEKDDGSIMIIMATDLPLSSRQLKRLGRRAGVGLSRIGSYIGHGSGDIVLAFSTARDVLHQPQSGIHDQDLDPAFRAAAEAVEEAILNSMITAETVTGRNGNKLYSLNEFIHKLL